MRALIPRYAPAWTDHNDSDPGIMLLQLFAWVTEGTIYRLNRIPLASELRFLELLGGGASTGEDGQPGTALTAGALDQMRVRAVAALRARSRAITPEDFEALVMDEGSYLELEPAGRRLSGGAGEMPAGARFDCDGPGYAPSRPRQRHPRAPVRRG